MAASSDAYRFGGFRSPTYTQVPDELFDELLPHLKEGELKALLYIIRRTFGFKREADSISFNQFLRGIVTREGRQLDTGSGLKSRTHLSTALKSLEQKGIILAEKSWDERGENQTTVYRLRLAHEVVPERHHPLQERVVPERHYRGTAAAPPVVPERYPQETVKQQTDEQERALEKSNGVNTNFGRERSVIIDYVADFAREFADQAPLNVSTTRALNLYQRAGGDLSGFIDRLYEARAITKERSASIRAEPVGAGMMPTRPKMAYFFAVLEDLLDGKEPNATTVTTKP